jgi:hypothetical protein
MIEIRKLKKDDMEELFDLLNTTFGTKYGRPMHFDLEQPKMWVKDDLHMERHLAVFEVYEEKCYGEGVTEIEFEAYLGETKMFKITEE